MGFAELKSTIHQNKIEPVVEKPLFGMKWLRYFLELPNAPFFVLKHLIITYLVTDKPFVSSIKITMIMFLLPLWSLFSFLLVFSFLGVEAAILLVVIQCLFFYLRLKLQGLNF
jgi:hypothetical protein